jgi:Skp family chaperone for outer membrane proteins
MFKKIFYFACFAVLCAAAPANAIEIPLETTKGGESFGYVDVQKLFEAYPKVLEAKQECEKFKSEKKEEIIKLENEIETLNNDVKESGNKINILKNTAASAQILPAVVSTKTSVSTSSSNAPAAAGPAAVSTQASVLTSSSNASTAAVVPDLDARISSFTAIIAEKKALVEKKSKELDEKKAKVEKELSELEDCKTQLIMADFYSVILDIAKEENISVVVDKSSILYGQPGIDLTDKVLDRLRGK